MTGPQAPPGKKRTGPLPKDRPSKNIADDDSHIIRLSLSEYGQLCELMFNLGASFASMQLHAEQEDVRTSDLVQQMWRAPRWTEVEKRRRPTDEPCGVRTCRGCSRCIRADAVKRGAARS